MNKTVELVHAVRGGVIDNVYRGCAAVVHLGGEVRFSLGDPEYRAFIRSAGKPLQAIALVELGGVEAFGLTDDELAIICASHSGGELQVRTVRSILRKIGVEESALQAGSGIRDNCSGKHAGMLALARLRGFPTEGYSQRDHPIQALILERVSAMSGLPVDEIDVAIDGCGAPIFAMPIRNMALAYACLANPEGLPHDRAEAARRIVPAMQNHPELVGGLDFRPICDAKVVAKAGASGCYCAGFCGKGLGFAMKVADGSSMPTLMVFFDVARRVGLIDEDEFARFLQGHSQVIQNRRGEAVGENRIVF